MSHGLALGVGHPGGGRPHDLAETVMETKEGMTVVNADYDAQARPYPAGHITSQQTVWCFHCERWAMYDGSRSDAAAAAKAEGWRIRAGKWACPNDVKAMQAAKDAADTANDPATRDRGN